MNTWMVHKKKGDIIGKETIDLWKSHAICFWLKKCKKKKKKKKKKNHSKKLFKLKLKCDCYNVHKLCKLMKY